MNPFVNGFFHAQLFDNIFDNGYTFYMITLEKRKKIHTWIFCFLTAFIVLLVASNNSFLYKFNDWIDVNWYITMGEGILDGKVIYRDLYDQKGPLTYFVFSFLALFNNVYYAVFILEVICLTVTLVLAHKLFSKFLNPMLSLIGVMLLSIVITGFYSFWTMFTWF